MEKKQEYKWQFRSIGGAPRVKINSGEDIRHLGELDRKLWTVLSCPVKGLEFDEKVLSLMDSDADGKIKVDEVIETAQWLTTVLKDPETLTKREDVIQLSNFNDDNDAGKALLDSAKQILHNLKVEKDSISLAETSDNVKIFADTLFNGDGIITPASAGGDERLAAIITKIVETTGKATDRSGVDGVTADLIEAFYTACADYSAWKAAAEADKENIFPYGDDTEAALAACEAIKEKVADYFMRCKLISFDEDAVGALDVSTEKIGAISGNILSIQTEEIASYPLVRPSKKNELPIEEGLNPAWKAKVDAVKTLVLDKEFPEASAISEEQWNTILGKFGPFIAWRDAKKGATVEALGLDEINAILKEDKKAALLELVDKDKALEAEALSIESVNKLVLLHKYFYPFLNNYVSFADFYDNAGKLGAIFQAGRLFIDQRSTDLCVRVEDMGKHADMASLSWMYILYCTCTSKTKGATMNIAAILTDGDTGSLKVGRNAVFYSRDGEDWDAVVTKIVDNPISLRQAFWAPYKKVGKWISEKFNKSAEDKNTDSLASLTASADKATATPAAGAPAKPSSFDIAKFAGIFAAIGMAIAYLSQALVSLIKGAAGLGLWKVLLVLLAIMLVISGPSVIITWRRLRRRDLGPLLNANGWAINAFSYVRQKFGASLTSLAKYPKLSQIDPKEKRKAIFRTIIWTLVVILLLCLGFLFFTDRLAKYGLPFHKEKNAPAEQIEMVEDVPAAPEAE